MARMSGRWANRRAGGLANGSLMARAARRCGCVGCGLRTARPLGGVGLTTVVCLGVYTGRVMELFVECLSMLQISHYRALFDLKTDGEIRGLFLIKNVQSFGLAHGRI